MVKRLIILTVFSFLSFLFSPSVLAQEEFATSYAVHYTVTESGLTKAIFQIVLKNKLSNIYAKEFSLSIGSTNLTDLRAYDSTGDLELKINKGQKTTNLIIPFTTKVLGKNQAQIFTLEFTSNDFANQSGQVWDITIPKLTDSTSLEDYQLILSIPANFGEPTILNPKPVSRTINGNYLDFRFNPTELLQSGINATFGNLQFFDFSLTYHLENKNVYPVKTEIALPPDTSLQKVYLGSIDPLPEQVSVDGDGNWLASFILSPRQTMVVVATGSAELHLNEENNQFPAIDKTQLDQYLGSQQFWEVDSPKIVKLASSLKTPQAIYQYVVDNLIYDYGRLSGASNRFGAANALDTPDSAICMEFTDLFIALSRAAGIPARAVNGYALTNNPALRPLSLSKDVLHAWPEYYDYATDRWVGVDPTWGNTTGGVDYFSQFDLNHFVFVKQGRDSTYPLPAGAYKLANGGGKDVNVVFGKSVLPISKRQLVVNLPSQAVAGVPIKGEVVIKNTGTKALYDIPLTISSTHFSIKNSTFSIPQIPPFGSLAIPIELPATSWTDNLTDVISARSGDLTVSHEIKLTPAYNTLFNLKNGLKIGIGLFLVLALGLGFTFRRRFYKIKE
jgi:transglutaminase-like putative cysteine protease